MPVRATLQEASTRKAARERASAARREAGAASAQLDRVLELLDESTASTSAWRARTDAVRTTAVALAAHAADARHARAARAEPTTCCAWRTLAPEGTAWAREAHAFARDVETLTHGAVRIKWYLGGIAGDELQTAERIRRGQLDGIASGGMLCMRLAPSMRVLRVRRPVPEPRRVGLRERRLRAGARRGVPQAGFVNLGEIGIGPDVFFSRTPVRTMADLQAGASVGVGSRRGAARWSCTAMGLEHGAAAARGRGARVRRAAGIDGFFAVPSAALAFQWSAQTRYIADLRLGFLRGCILVANRAYDELPIETQQALRSASAKLLARIEELGRSQDEALLGGLFDKQGVKPVQVVERRSAREFFERRARRARTARRQAGAAGAAAARPGDARRLSRGATETTTNAMIP